MSDMIEPRWDDTVPAETGAAVAEMPVRETDAPVVEGDMIEPRWDDTVPVEGATWRELKKAPERALESSMDTMAGLQFFLAELTGNKEKADYWKKGLEGFKRAREPQTLTTNNGDGTVDVVSSGYDPVLGRDPAIYGGTITENPSVARVLGGAAPSMIDTAAAMPLGTAGLAFLTLKETMPFYVAEREKGVSKPKAMAAATLHGIGTFVLERIGMSGLKTGAIPKKVAAEALQKTVAKVAKEWAVGTAKEAGTEGLQQAWQNAVGEGFDGTFEDWKDFTKQVGGALKDPDAWKQLAADLTAGVAESTLVGAVAGGAVKAGTQVGAAAIDAVTRPGARSAAPVPDVGAPVGKMTRAPEGMTIPVEAPVVAPVVAPGAGGEVAPGVARSGPVAAALAKYEGLPNAKAYAQEYADWVAAGKPGKARGPRWKVSDIVAKKIRVDIQKAVAAAETAALPAEAVAAKAAGKAVVAGPVVEEAPVAAPLSARLGRLVETYTLPNKKEYAQKYWAWMDAGAKGPPPRTTLQGGERNKVRQAVQREWEADAKGFDRLIPADVEEAQQFEKDHLQEGLQTVAAGNYGRTAIHIDNKFAAKVNLGRAYPVGWDGESARDLGAALAEIKAGKDPTARQKKLVQAAAYDLKRMRDAEANEALAGLDQPGQRQQVPVSDLSDGALVFRDGEWRMVRTDPDAEGVLLKGATADERLGFEAVTEAAIVAVPGAKGYGDALRMYEGQERLIPENVRKSDEVAPVSGEETDMPSDFLDRAEAAVDEKITKLKAEGPRLGSGPFGQAAEASLWIAKGAIKIARGVKDFAAWAAEMLKEFGEAIRPHLEGIYVAAQEQARRPESIGAVAESAEAYGRPDLANPGETEEVRAVVDAIDQMRNEAELPESKSEADARVRAGARVAVNTEGEWKALLGGKWFNVHNGQEDTAVAQELLNRKGVEAWRAGDDAALLDLAVGVFQYREQGSDLARSMAMRRDRVERPEVRNQRLINEALLMPGEADRKTVRDAIEKGDAKYLAKVVARAKAAAAELVEMGYDVANLDAETLADPEAVAEIIRVGQNHHANFGDMLLEYWLNVGLLGSPKTVVQNLGGTYAHAVWTHTVDRMAQGVVNVVARQKGAPDVRDAVEALKVIAPGMHRAAWNAAKLAFQTEQPQLLIPGSKIEAPIAAIPGRAGRVVRLAGRALRFGDEFAKRVAYEMVMAEQAYEQAKQEGLVGPARIARARIVAASPSVEMVAKAVTDARTETFTGKNGPLVQAVQKLKVTPGWRYAAYAVMPFTSAPGQLVRTIARRSPLGVVRMLFRGIQRAGGGGAYAGHGDEFVKDLAEQLVGAALLWLGLGMFRSEDNPKGRLSGSQKYTNKVGERSMRYADAPPNSLLIGDVWYSYNQLDPAAGQVQLWIDTARAAGDVGKGRPGAAVERMFEASKSLIRDKPFLQGLGEIVKAAEAGDKGLKTLAQYGAGMASSFVPRIWRDVWSATDPMIRDLSVRQKDGRGATYVKRALQRGTPMPAVMPPPKRDLWGRPVQKGDVLGSDFVWRMVVPVRTQAAVDEMNVERMIFNYNRVREDGRQLWPGMPSDSVEVRGVVREMSEADYDAFLVRRGQIVLDTLAKRRLNVNDPDWRDMQVVLTAFERATAIARGEYLRGVLADAASAAALRRDIRESRK